MFARLFRSNPAKVAGRQLYDAVTAQARTPAFYAELGAPDTVEGRFELYNLHVVLILHRMKGLGGQAGKDCTGFPFRLHIGVSCLASGISSLPPQCLLQPELPERIRRAVRAEACAIRSHDLRLRPG